MFKERWYVKEVEQHVNKEVVKRLYKTAFIVEGAIKEEITRLHLIDKSMFKNSITHEMFEDELMVRVGSPINNPPYPLYLELGTLSRYDPNWENRATSRGKLNDGRKGIPPYAPMRTGLVNSKKRTDVIWR